MRLDRPQTSFREIINLIHKSYLPKIISIGMEIGLFDRLKDEMTSKEIADSLKLQEYILEPMLKVLETSGFLEKQCGGYSLTQLSKDFLVSDSPFFQGGYINRFQSEGKMIDKAIDSLVDGAPDFNPYSFSDKEVLVQLGNSAKAGSIQDLAEFVYRLPEFKNMKSMCDVAGSYGYLTMGILDMKSDLTGVVYDLPEVAEMSKDIIVEKGYEGRIENRGFSLSEGDSFGSGYDLVLTSHCLYMIDGDARKRFFSQVYDALNPGGVYISCHLTTDAEGDDYLTETIKEFLVRSVGVETHHLEEDYLKSTLSDIGFSDFEVSPGRRASFYNNMILAARKG